MKKVFIAAAFAATMGLVLISCDKDKQRCWKITYTIPTTSKVVEEYWWCTETALDTQTKRLKDLGYTDIKKSKQNKYKTQEDCKLQNEKEQ